MYKRIVSVVHIINSLGLGGSERFACDLIRNLDRNRFQPRVLCLYHEGELAPSLQAAGVPVNFIGIRRKIGLDGWIHVTRALCKLNADVVHAHLPEASWFGMPAAWIAGVPIRIAHLQNCHRTWPWKLRLLDRVASQFATKTIACSEAVRSFYQKEIHYPSTKLRVLCNSIDLERFNALPARGHARQFLNLPQDSFILVSVASLSEQKGHSYLIEAMVKVCSERPEALLLIVGDGFLRHELERSAEQNKLMHNIRFLGRRTDVPLILAASDLFVLSSLWEGLPLALAEAGAAGLATIATRVDGNAEIINDGITGLLVPAQNPELFADTILRVIADTGYRMALAKAAREHIMDRFSIKRIVRDVEQLYVDTADALQPL